jgi:predicted dehydrogenase
MAKVTRRSFFQGAAVAASATRVVGANDRIALGVVGIGGRGRAHVTRWSQITDCEVRGLCDVNQAARERGQALLKNEGGAEAKEFTDMRKMFDDSDIDAVSMTTPNHWHALSTIWACEAGKDVYCEKPACHTP